MTADHDNERRQQITRTKQQTEEENQMKLSVALAYLCAHLMIQLSHDAAIRLTSGELERRTFKIWPTWESFTKLALTM